MPGIEYHPVGAAAHLDRSARLTDGVRAMLRGVTPKPSADVRLGVAREHTALLLAQSLLVLQPAQFLGGTYGGLAVGAHAETSARVEITDRVEEPVAQVGLGADRDTHACAGGGEAGELRAVGMGGVHQAPLGSEQSRVEQQFDRTPAGRADTGPYLENLFRHMDM